MDIESEHALLVLLELRFDDCDDDLAAADEDDLLVFDPGTGEGDGDGDGTLSLS